jgi:membrane-associated PAP2 superfamily phosphatase
MIHPPLFQSAVRETPLVSVSRNRFYFNHVGIPLLLAIALFITFDLTGLDRILSDWMYDTSTHAFPLQHSKLFETITHKWARIIPNWTGEAAIIGALLSFLWPRFKAEKHAKMMAWLEQIRVAPFLRLLTRHRRDLLFVVFAFSITTGFIHYFKSHTSTIARWRPPCTVVLKPKKNGSRTSVCCMKLARDAAGRAGTPREDLP